MPMIPLNTVAKIGGGTEATGGGDLLDVLARGGKEGAGALDALALDVFAERAAHQRFKELTDVTPAELRFARDAFQRQILSKMRA